MNDLELFSEPKKTMTIKEVALALQKDESTIRKIGKDLFPNLFVNGISTHLNEMHVTAIKMNLGKNSELPKTTLEKELLIMQAMQFQQERIIQLQEQLLINSEKVESYNCLMKTDKDMSISEASKHFNIHPKKEVFPYLREHGYLTKKDLPTQYAIDACVLSLRQSEPDRYGYTHSQAIVKACHLDRFRKLVADKI